MRVKNHVNTQRQTSSTHASNNLLAAAQIAHQSDVVVVDRRISCSSSSSCGSGGGGDEAAVPSFVLLHARQRASMNKRRSEDAVPSTIASLAAAVSHCRGIVSGSEPGKRCRFEIGGRIIIIIRSFRMPQRYDRANVLRQSLTVYRQ